MSTISQTVLQKISFTNPYGVEKEFHIQTSQPSIITIKEDVVQLAPNSTLYLHLSFATMQNPTRSEVYIFINDHMGNGEECFCVKLQYK
jgi:hypothetical protein